MNAEETKEIARFMIALTSLVTQAGFNIVKDGNLDLTALADALENCTIQRNGETNIVRESGKDGETNFVMAGTTAWITVANPNDPTETGAVRIGANNEGITTEIWPNSDETECEDALCYSFWGDLNPEQEPA